MEQPASYRDSHTGKGADYHEAFDKYPHRNMVWRLEKIVLTRVIRTYLQGRPPRHLDFASGTGRILLHLGPYSACSTAVDVSASMLAIARLNSPDARFVEGDITRDDILPGEDFDLITAFRFFPNAEAELRRDVLVELVERLDNDGYLVFNNHINNRSLLHRMSAIRRGTGMVRGMNDKEVAALTRAAGLRIIKRYPLAILPLGETRMFFPRAIYWLERGLAKLPGIASLAQNVIYVCAKLPV